MSYETLPSIELKGTEGIKIERPIVEIADAEVDEQVERIAENAREYDPKDGKAARKVTASPWISSARSTARHSKAAPPATPNLVIGSKQFIPGFEEQLVGVSAGDEKVVELTFPDDYGAASI